MPRFLQSVMSARTGQWYIYFYFTGYFHVLMPRFIQSVMSPQTLFISTPLTNSECSTYNQQIHFNVQQGMFAELAIVIRSVKQFLLPILVNQ